MENQNPEKYLFQLTVKEYESLMKKILQEKVPEMIREELREELETIKAIYQKSSRDSITVDEVAQLTGLKIRSIYTKVSRLEMPAIMRGRPLMFSRREIISWMRDGKPSVSIMRYDEYEKNRKK